jgi:hypothetical protein
MDVGFRPAGAAAIGEFVAFRPIPNTASGSEPSGNAAFSNTYMHAKPTGLFSNTCTFAKVFSRCTATTCQPPPTARRLPAPGDRQRRLCKCHALLYLHAISDQLPFFQTHTHLAEFFPGAFLTQAPISSSRPFRAIRICHFFKHLHAIGKQLPCFHTHTYLRRNFSLAHCPVQQLQAPVSRITSGRRAPRNSSPRDDRHQYAPPRLLEFPVELRISAKANRLR